MRDVVIIGVGMHKFGKFLDKDLKELTRVAVWNAIHDASIDAPKIEAAYFANVLAGLITGQECIRGHVFLRDAGFEGIPIVNVEGACASGSIALREAMIAVGAGFIGFSLLALEFALISRIEAAAQPFGEDSLQLFHNIMGGCCCAGSSPGPSDYFGFFWLSCELLAQPIC